MLNTSENSFLDVVIAPVPFLYQLSECNLEFQGSARNLQKRTLFLKFYPEMSLNNTEVR